MSTQITTEQIKELRDTTGISVMQCKRALEEAEGDMNKALAILKKTSSDIALKKVSREVKDGRVSIKTDGKKAVLVSLHCETDFVARNEDFTKLLDGLTERAFLEGIEKMQAEAKARRNLSGNGRNSRQLCPQQQDRCHRKPIRRFHRARPRHCYACDSHEAGIHLAG